MCAIAQTLFGSVAILYSIQTFRLESISSMTRGDKSAYTSKQKRQARHIEEGYEDRGVSKMESEGRAWATVNKHDGGGKKKVSRRKPAKITSSDKKNC